MRLGAVGRWWPPRSAHRWRRRSPSALRVTREPRPDGRSRSPSRPASRTRSSTPAPWPSPRPAAALALVRPVLVKPSDITTMTAGTFVSLPSVLTVSMASREAKMASPIAVRCWRTTLRTAALTRARFVVGGTTTLALPAKVTSPSLNFGGRMSAKRVAASCAACEAGRLHILGRHRQRDVEREHHGRPFTRYLRGPRGPGERDDRHCQREQEQRRREMTPPPRPLGGDRRQEIDVGEAHHVLASLPLHHHVRDEEQRDEEEENEPPAREEAHVITACPARRRRRLPTYWTMSSSQSRSVRSTMCSAPAPRSACAVACRCAAAASA